MHHALIVKSLLFILITGCLTLSPRTDTQRIKRATTPRPGFFRTLFSVAWEQWSDTKNTYSKINNMINSNFLPENAPPVVSTTPSADPNVTTTAAPYKIKRSEFSRILRRNIRGLVRLFNIEMQDALRQSRRTDIEYRKNATKEYSKFL